MGACSLSPGPSPRSCLGVLLAAGEGTRMRSAKPKPLHEIAGRSMLAHALAALVEAGCGRIAVVVGPGPGGEALAEAAKRIFPDAEIFVQAERRGTAHAVLAARAALERGTDDVLMHYADTSLVRPETLRNLREGLAEAADWSRWASRRPIRPATAASSSATAC